ncbi:MAG: response regulator transcription factor [Thermodesulfobacteriota bacterium]
MAKIRVMIVDDHVIVREGIKQLLEIEPDIEVVAEAASGLECLDRLESHRPDVIFMDVRMPGISGIEATRLVLERHPEARVIMLTIYDDDEHVTDAIKAGAKAYILKKASRRELVDVVRHVVEDRAYLDPGVASSVFAQLRRGGTPAADIRQEPLTRRELEVLQRLVLGDTDRKIAQSLFISEHTVRSHLKSLYRKLGVSSKSQAVAKAVQDKIIDQ